MAVTLIRRVCTTSAFRSALRFASASGSQRYHHQYPAIFSAVNRRSSDLCGIIYRRLVLSAFRPYHSLSAVDDSVVRVLDEEINSAIEMEDADEPPQVPPEDFPFRIEDTPSQCTITLLRHYQGKKISVQVGMTNITEEAEYQCSQEDITQSFKFCLVVRVERNRKSCLQFVCTAYSDEITIDSLSLKNPDESVEEDELAYEGPEFCTLDEKLKKELLKYLEVRGIKPSIIDFLLEYMDKKESREYLLWLNNIKGFMTS